MADELTRARSGELRVADRDVVPSLVEVRRDRKRYPRIYEVGADALFPQMRNLVNYAALLRGQKMDPDVIDFTAAQLSDLLLEKNELNTRQLTFYEIKRAVKKGILEDREMFGISVQGLLSIIRRYVMTEGHEADRKAMEKPEVPEPATPTLAMKMLTTFAEEFSKTHKIK